MRERGLAVSGLRYRPGALRGGEFSTGAMGNFQPALTVSLTPEEKVIAKAFFLLTDKPTIFACNVKESELAQGDKNSFVQKVVEYVKTHLACEAVVISAQIESDLIDLSAEEAKAFLKDRL